MRRTPATTGLTPAQFQLAKVMPEDKGCGSLLSTVIEQCHVRRLLIAHFRAARVGGTDRNRFVTPVQGDRELKTFTGQVSPEQHRWMDALDAAGEDVAVWDPIDYYSGRIIFELDALCRREAS